MQTLAGVHDAVSRDGHAEFNVDPSDLNHGLEALVDLEVRALVTSPPTLEELFMRHHGEDASTVEVGT